jgi:hypothetical protein
MAEDYDIFDDMRTAWMLALGRRLRAEYDAVLEPAPARLTTLLEQLATAASDRTVQQSGDGASGS